MSRNKQPLMIEHAILGFLREQPLHGYEVYQRLSAPEALGSIWPLKQSQFYALIARLEEEGYLAVTLEPRGALPSRKVLQLTPAGMVAFTDWLYSPGEPGDELQRSFLARLYFAQQLGSATLHQLLVGQRQQSRAWLHTLRRELHESTVPHSYLWLVRQWQIRQTEAILDWLDTFDAPPQLAPGVAHPIAVLADSPAADLAQAFEAFVCGPEGQTQLARAGFFPAGAPLNGAAALASAPAFPLSGELIVYAAAVFTTVFETLGTAFRAAHPGISLHFTFGGSLALAAELVQGARADVYVPAHQGAMASVLAAGRVRPEHVRTFAHNQLAIVTPSQRPTMLRTLGDLTQTGLRLAIGSGATAIGRYTQEAFAAADRSGSFGTAGAAAVLHNVVYYAETVTDVLAKVVQGEVDAGIVFTSDYHQAAGQVQVAVVPSLR